jgi:ribosomal protein L7/L12
MRLKAYIRNDDTYKKAIISEWPGSGVYLFLYDTVEDAACIADLWFETIADAQADAHERFGLTEQAWTVIADALPGMQHDWERPTRVVHNADGTIELIAYQENQVPVITDLDSEYGKSLDSVDAALVVEVQALIQSGQPITAIKLYKEKVGVSLRKAKYAVERLKGWNRENR